MSANVKPLLFDRLRESGLLDAAQLEELAGLPEALDPDPRALAKQVLQRGWLTLFQLNLVARGKAADLSVGPYVLLDRLGEGGMGQVFKARHRHLSRVVALKLIRSEKLESPEAVQRFYQEVKAAGQLHHPNIVLAYDAGQSGDAHFLSMEFVDGHDLARLVKERGPLPVAEACDYVRQAALGLQYAHEQGMVHRDIKPHNLMLAPGRVVKILDMGLARLHTPSERDHALTRSGALLGTPDFLAPEQALNSRGADIRSDLYSLGCTLYYLLAGRAPFHAESLTQLLLQHQTEEPAPLESLRPDVPGGLAALVRALLAKRPEDRPQTPAEVATALGPYGGEGGPAPAAFPRPAAADVPAATVTGPKVAAHPAEAATTSWAIGPGSAAPAQRSRASLVLALVGAAVVLPLVALLGVAVLVCLFYLSARPSTRPAAPPHERGDVVQRPPAQPVNPAPAVPPPAAHPAVPPVGRELRQLPPNQMLSIGIAFSPDSRRVLLSDNQTPSLWDVDTGQLLRRMPPSNGTFGEVCFSPDGRRAYLACADRSIHIWDPDTGRNLGRLEHAVNCLAVTADGRHILSGSGEGGFGKPFTDCLVCVWDADTLQDVGHFDGHSTPVRQVSISADGRRALSRSDDSLCLWEVATRREVRRLPAKGGPVGELLRAFLFQDGRQALLASRDGTLRVWDLENEREVRKFGDTSDHLSDVVLSQDGRRALSATYQFQVVEGKAVYENCLLHLWDLPSCRELRQLEGHTHQIAHVAISPDDRRALSVGHDTTIRIWDLSADAPPR